MRNLPLTVTVSAMTLLSACGSADLSVRTTAQIPHPSQFATTPPHSVMPDQTTAPQRALANFGALRENLFQEFCLGYPSASASETAVRASGRFNEPAVSDTYGARYAIYPLRDKNLRAGVTLVTGSGGNIQCSAAVNNIGSILYEGGRIVRQ